MFGKVVHERLGNPVSRMLLPLLVFAGSVFAEDVASDVGQVAEPADTAYVAPADTANAVSVDTASAVPVDSVNADSVEPVPETPVETIDAQPADTVAPADTLPSVAADTAAPVASDTVLQVAASEDSVVVEKESSSGWRKFFSWPFNHIVQPALNGIVYPIAQPIRYAFDNGVIETAVDLITFGEKRNVLLYPIMNLKPGSSTMLGFTYRHRSLIFNKDYLVVSPQFFANGDWYADLRYTKHELLGSRLFGGLRLRQYWDRDASFNIPGTKESFAMPDSSTYIDLRTGFPITRDGHWSLEFSGSVEFMNFSLPDKSQDSILIDPKFFVSDRGLYQNFVQYPLEVSLLFDNLDFPFTPSRGSRMELSCKYVFVGKYEGISQDELSKTLGENDYGSFEDNGRNHDYIRTEIMLQHYFYFGKAENFHFSKKEARQNRRFYTDFNWNAALRMWRPENVRETLFERRVIALQYRLVDIWEMDQGSASVDAFPLVGPRFPLRGYSDSWSIRHVMSLSAEYRWPIDYYVDGVLFNEYMMHAPGFTDWSLDHLYNSWGFGVRVRRPDMYWFRVQLGFHGLHGVNFVVTIAPEFR